MSIPRQLIKSFEIIQNCKLVTTNNPTEDNLKEFGKAMNNAIPESDNEISYMIYKFMRGMYLKDKPKFIEYIKNIHYYQAMILWTDYDDILEYFGLNGVVFLGWNKAVNKYQASKIDTTRKKENKHVYNQSSNTFINNFKKIEYSIEEQSKSILKNFTIPEDKPIEQTIKYTDNITQTDNNTKTDSKKLIEEKINLFERDDDFDILYSRVGEIQKKIKTISL